MNKYLEVSKPVAEALDNNKPVIALESTIISHGMPYPQNIKVAKHLEKIARDKEVEPATICLMNGKIKIGLSDPEIESLAKDKVEKVSSRDISRILSNKKTGATTVAATMIAAKLAGIKVFATGGIGGVHRFAEESFDISNDLIELSRNPVIVVSAGAKAILDLHKTLEILETFGVPVYGYRTNHFPAFYSASSNIFIETIDSVEMIKKIFYMNRELDINCGMLIANPIPKKYEIKFKIMNNWIEKALERSAKMNITGKELTPFLLSEIAKISTGRSLEANIKLVENNVRLGCEIAKQF